ncbi:MAG: prolyl oligopeptidase family serine peptidase, partial [Planctomycetota bacterium]
KNDVLVYEEKDEEFRCGIGKSRSRKSLLIQSSQTLSTETRFLPADQPAGQAVIFLPRKDNHEYSINHLGDQFYIRTNWDATNFRLMKCPESDTVQSGWTDVVPHDPDVFFGGYQLFDQWLAVSQKEGGQTRIRFRSWDESDWQNLDFGEPCYQASFGYSPEPNTQQLRYNFSSLKTPNSVFAFDMKNQERELLKQDEILGDFNSDDYETEFLFATARDGVKVPISLIYHKDTPIDGTAPCLVYGYGSYGASMSASFSSSRFNLIDRGFIYAIAHIRGGQEMGRRWYEDGKLLNKKNTFTDFIDCTKFLVAEKYADKERVFARGGSAGGLLMGAVINMAPELYQAVIADVPFVDVVTTMLDESIPLTTSEYDEWGNPNDQKYYQYMLSYSPYDQVEAKNYPNMLVTTGLHDSQVQYWEPAKWVARLRDRKTDDNMLVLKTNMTAGHGGASGRYDRYKEIALRHAFLLFHAGIEK